LVEHRTPPGCQHYHELPYVPTVCCTPFVDDSSSIVSTN